MDPIVIAAFYKFANLSDYLDYQIPLKVYCIENNIKGTILLAQEGINGTVAGDQKSIEQLMAHIAKDKRLEGIEYKISYASRMPFSRIKVKLKKEIITLGVPVDALNLVGTYINPQDWNALILDKTVTVIDTRNDYEIRVGTFRNAHNPQTKHFGAFPKYVAESLDPSVHTKIAMMCTGGIRCEKSTAFLKARGFKEVYHLKGGILNYLEQIPAAESLWEGECFVFDQRVSVTHGVRPGTYVLCYACQEPLSTKDCEDLNYKKGISCPYCVDNQNAKRRDRFEQRQLQIELARKRGQSHIKCATSSKHSTHSEN